MGDCNHRNACLMTLSHVDIDKLHMCSQSFELEKKENFKKVFYNNLCIKRHKDLELLYYSVSCDIISMHHTQYYTF